MDMEMFAAQQTQSSLEGLDELDTSFNSTENEMKTKESSEIKESEVVNEQK